MRLNSILIVAAVLCLTLAGCPDADDQAAVKPAQLPFAGQSVGIAVPAGLDFLRHWEGPLREWGAQTGAQVELVEYQSDDAALTAQLNDAGRTIVVFPLERLGELIDGDRLAPIPAAILDDVNGVNWLDVLGGLRDGPASPRRKPGLVPVNCPVLVCYYRQDLLDSAGLKPPQTWDDYRKLLDSLADWAPGLSAVEPWHPDFCVSLALARSAAFARHPGHYSLFFEIDSGKPLIDGPGFVRGFEKSLAAFRKLNPDSRQLSPAQCRDRVVRGQAALALGYEPARTDESAADAADSSDGRPDGARIGISRLPGSAESYNPTRQLWDALPDKRIHYVTLCGFSGLATAALANRGAEPVEAGWNAISRLGSQGFVSGFPAQAVGLCRESQVPSSGAVAGPELLGNEAAAYGDAVAVSLREPPVVFELPVVRRGEFRAALAAAVQSMLEGQATPSDALATAAAKWQSLVDEIGPERLKNNYRAALGLGSKR